MIAYGSELVSDERTNEGVKPGDLIHVCLHYAGITNVFYKVLMLNGAQSITICPIGKQQRKHEGFLKTYVRPDYDSEGEPIRVRVTRRVYRNEATGEESISRTVQIHKTLTGIIIEDDPDYWWTDDDAD